MTVEIMEKYKPVLAMYDIRGKQEFIFRSQRIKEIIGGSAIIRDCYKDYLFSSIEESKDDNGNCIYGKGIYGMNVGEDNFFTEEGFEKHVTQEGYIGEIVYEGGGNFLLLYKNVEYYKEITYNFTKKILEEIGSLKVLGSYIEDVNFDDYRGDNKRLYDKHRKDEATSANAIPWGTLPIVQTDLRASAPLVCCDEKEGKISKESKAKYKKYKEEKNNNVDSLNENILDNLVAQKGVDSNLAIVYIDGNSMGAKVQNCYKNINGILNYENCVRELRKFSAQIQKDYLDDRINDIDNALKKLHENDNNKNVKRRLILKAGDEINFICRASDAYTLVKAYLENLPQGSSSCAGVAIFNSHAPYADAYRIAEECCESGKAVMKKKGIEDISFIDFHYCQGAIGISLEEIRRTEQTLDYSRPWMVKVAEKEADKTTDIASVQDVEKLVAILNTFGRSNVKGLLIHSKNNSVNLKMEINRIIAHMPGDKMKNEIFEMWKEYDEKHGQDSFAKLIYDTVLMYDLWFDDKCGGAV